MLALFGMLNKASPNVNNEILPPKSVPTQHALDAGDSAHIPSIFYASAFSGWTASLAKILNTYRL